MSIDEAYDEWRAGKSDVPWSREAFAAGAAWQAGRYERLVKAAEAVIADYYVDDVVHVTSIVALDSDDPDRHAADLDAAVEHYRFIAELREALAECKGEQ